MKSFLAARLSFIPCLLGAAAAACAQTAGSATPQHVTVGANWALSLLGANTLLLGIGIRPVDPSSVF